MNTLKTRAPKSVNRWGSRQDRMLLIPLTKCPSRRERTSSSSLTSSGGQDTNSTNRFVFLLVSVVCECEPGDQDPVSRKGHGMSFVSNVRVLPLGGASCGSSAVSSRVFTPLRAIEALARIYLVILFALFYNSPPLLALMSLRELIECVIVCYVYMFLFSIF